MNKSISISSFETYLSKIIYPPLKKTSKYKLKFKGKAWIIPDLQKSIAVKNELLKKFI